MGLRRRITKSMGEDQVQRLEAIGMEWRLQKKIEQNQESQRQKADSGKQNSVRRIGFEDYKEAV